jgi:membrane protease YdiL (CAAX protease family)
MNATGVWTGLSESAFLAGVDERERDPRRLVTIIIGGAALGLVAALCVLLIIAVVYTLLTGQGPRGVAGLAEVARVLGDARTIAPAASALRLAVTTGVDGAFPLVFVAFAALVLGRPPGVFVTVARRPRWRLLAMGMVLAAAAMSPLVIAERALAGPGATPPFLAVSPHLGDRISYGLSAFLLIPAAAAEELFFRGWLLRETGAFLRRPLMLVGVNALIFSALHFDFAPDAFLTLALMGGGFAYMTLRLGGVEFSAGAHAAYNMVIVLFVQPLEVQPAADGEVSLVSLAVALALAGGHVLITEAVARHPVLRSLAGLQSAEISPSGDITARFS